MISQFLDVLRSCFSPTGTKNRRRWTRRKRCTLLTLQELDDDLSPVGDPKWAMSQDISRMGIGFVTKQPVPFNYVRITVVEDGFSAIGLIRHSREVEENPEQYFVGVEFLEDYACHER